MHHSFLIFGYGIPKDIFKDKPYNHYLQSAVKIIIEVIKKYSVKYPLVICSGGNTDCFRPYKRSEAEEMIFLLQDIFKKEHLGKIAKNWKLVAEGKSLSTLENIIFCAEILRKRNIKDGHVHIFCDKTRYKRVYNLAEKVFGTGYKIYTHAVDFDNKLRQRLGSSFISKKERNEYEFALWALKSPKNFKIYKKVFKEKIITLRRAAPKDREKVILRWWKDALPQKKSRLIT